MPRRKLDRYVSSFVDRHGKERFRFRRFGVSRYLPPPGSKEYRIAYHEALNGIAGLDRVRRGSINDLVARYYQSIPFRNMGPSWQRTVRQVLEAFREEYGNDRVRDFRPKDINAIVAKKIERGTSAAKRLREVLLRLFEFAVADEMRTDNPVKLAEKVAHKATGFHAWTEAEIEQYRERWPLGTKARLALELMLWTGLRRGDARLLAPPVNGRFRIKAGKTGKWVEMGVPAQLQYAINAMPEIGETLLTTDYGRPFTAAGLGNKIREWCDEAGLKHCTAHGLRKALARRGAELGLSQQELKAVGQWENDSIVRGYVESANRTRLADGAIRRVAEWEQARTLASPDLEGV